MKVFFLCGAFEKEYEQEVLKNARRAVEYSANLFQEKLICGFLDNDVDLEIISAPFIGSFPNASKIFRFRGFSSNNSKYEYVKFNNLWGFRNFSRCKALKQSICQHLRRIPIDEEVRIVVYSPHTPFLEAAVYAKKSHPNTHICLIIPDLPQYMNLDSKISLLYKLGKKYDIKKFEHLNTFVDSYVLLTEHMKEKINLQDKPFLIAEGIVTTAELTASLSHQNTTNTTCDTRYIVYAGKMNYAFGVATLVDAFCQLKDANLRLILCGIGDAVTYVQSKTDPRIMHLGQVTPETAKMWMQQATVLVNPRSGEEVYTRYSFPSKNIEYLLTGRNVVAYKLAGIPDAYRDFILFAEQNSADALASAIGEALEQKTKSDKALCYLREHCLNTTICSNILQMR